MQIVGKAVNVVQELKLTELVPAERRCSYCTRPFEFGEKVVVLSETVYGNDEIDLPDDNIYVLHIKNPHTDEYVSCLEEFVSRLSVYQKDSEGEKPSEIAKKDGEVEVLKDQSNTSA